ncbi:MAG: gamma-glutamyltransferase [Pyrinomonadaceae bacterium]|nr:gamma-glutamyltransferase [Pyrinomonadaceae bacterium]
MLIRRTLKKVAIVGLFALLLVPGLESQAYAQHELAGSRDASSKQGMVVAVSPDGAAVGAKILKQGGNAVDAAIATAFALAVTHPSAGNIGGGGFMLIHPSDGGPPIFIDYREKAPLSSTRDMYIDGGSRKNHRYVGVPGTVRGLKLAHEIYGSLEWSKLVEPAVRLAKDGFSMHAGLAGSLNFEVKNSINDEFKRVYGKADGTQWKSGDRIVLKDLGATLDRIAKQGTKGFYQGETARLLVEEMKKGGGYVRQADLDKYRARVRTPIRFKYREYDVYSAPPPSSGGITLAQMMGISEQFDLKSKGRWSTETNHIMIEAMRRAYANRAMYLADADFVSIPKYLTTKSFAKYLSTTIDLKRATKSDSLGPRITEEPESKETTHFSVVDKNGMAVSNTYTLEAAYGSEVVVRGAGFILNNEMGDFNGKPGVTNRRGRIGTPANIVEPEKRMLSSMTPTIVGKNGKAYLVTGSPGGRTIINTVFCVTLNVLEFGMSAREAVDAPRMDHEWFPERVRFMGADKPRFATLVKELGAMGHNVQDTNGQGDANTIMIKDGIYIGAADYRYGAAAGVMGRQ